MKSFVRRRLQLLVWASVLASLFVWTRCGDSGWDLGVYKDALSSIQQNNDPYADAIGRQKLAYSHGAIPAGVDPPFAYVYPPITLLFLRAVAGIPWVVVATLYWLAYASGILSQLWVMRKFAFRWEERWYSVALPLSLFFPGMLADGTVLSGNVARILYGAVLAAAVPGWRRGYWQWFYLAVFAAACVKLPLLTLVCIPLLCSKQQWIPAGITTVASLGVVTLQAVFCPDLFRHWLEAVDLQFRLNRDFGSSPAGIFGQALSSMGLPYFPTGLLFYLAYALPLFVLLRKFSRRHLAGEFGLKQWLPVMTMGVILLNPRLIEYDTAVLSLPMALIFVRACRSGKPGKRVVMGVASVWILCNAMGLYSWSLRKIVDCVLLMMTFAVGAWNLSQATSKAESNVRQREDVVSLAGRG